MKRLDEQGADALVPIREPVNKFPDFVRYWVQRLATLCPRLGKLKTAEIPCQPNSLPIRAFLGKTIAGANATPVSFTAASRRTGRDRRTVGLILEAVHSLKHIEEAHAAVGHLRLKVELRCRGPALAFEPVHLVKDI